MIIRVGVEPGRAAVLATARRRGMSVLISANTLWDDKARKFTGKWKHLKGLDVALDSGGFVAMSLYGRYRYTAQQYVELVSRMEPTWWAAMDYCCEPEIAGSSSKVQARVEATVDNLLLCMAEAVVQGVPMPLPVIQGWKAQDYVRCVNLMSEGIFLKPEDWPALVGVGSVCRRHLTGQDSLHAILNALDQVLPPHVRLHLFGVKGAALRSLSHRVASMDSMAWNMGARWHAFHSKQACDQKLRAAFMETWFDKQLAHTAKRQLSLAI